ncbi:hypothetical protein [Plantactinospora sp. KLBMP9567]|uniref:hypothetical protein n=1 Tax=Plantactinospora sp. KLBMP9567 TaxID=3085900 RepID=UPI00298222CA|nr:hypothetical protein [Plantactinospora sp. KLBMP9567]MDW5327199.1 hypothetical protein [Plantactinospora sp. KLBMP9567]
MSRQSYRDRVAQDRARADRVADDLDRVADTVVAHAQEIRELLALIARIEDEVTRWFETAAQRLRDYAPLADGPLLKAAVDAPWAAWPFQPGNLPASGIGSGSRSASSCRARVSRRVVPKSKVDVWA